MAHHRFFVTTSLPEAGADAWPVPLSPNDLHHLVRVVRLAPGERVVLVGRGGQSAEAVLRSISAEGVVADVEPPVAGSARPRVALAQGLTRRERMEYAIQKTTELGVSEIVPVGFARSVVKLADERAEARRTRWQRIAEEAAKQSQRSDVPLVLEATDLAGLIELAKGYDVVLVPWEEDAHSAGGVGEALGRAGANAQTSVLVVVGPEGGLEAAEVDELVTSAAGIRVSLGDTILRTETAAVIAVALAAYELGGLGGRGR